MERQITIVLQGTLACHEWLFRAGATYHNLGKDFICTAGSFPTYIAGLISFHLASLETSLLLALKSPACSCRDFQFRISQSCKLAVCTLSHQYFS